MGDVELGQHRSASSSPSLTADHQPEPVPRAPQPREFSDEQKRCLLGTLCPRLEIDETVLEEWNEHLQNLIELVYRFRKGVMTSGGFRLSPLSVEGAVEAITSTIKLVRAFPEEPWRIMLERLHPLQETSGLETHHLAACVVYFWFRVRMMPYEFASNGPWSHERSLVHNVVSRFPGPAPAVEAGFGQTLSHDFTGPNISRFYGIRIQRTDSLDRHLELDNHDPSIGITRKRYFVQKRDLRRKHPTLRVFCDTPALETLFREELDDGSPACPMPRALYRDVSNSFGILFPRPALCAAYFGDAAARDLSWGYYSSARERNLARYDRFRARLGVLLDVYNSPTVHWWHPLVDRRNKREHFTLWIAIWAFVFGFLSLLTGLVSGVYAVKQYDLGLAAACAESGDHPRMKSYCG
ncbi:hypothetical protein LX36DRAFT_414158 [Colletotrichum falcatum]|nr:hypothetical protein LX36DRAFT_414158 [Colletotrichum falcatum]